MNQIKQFQDEKKNNIRKLSKDKTLQSLALEFYRKFSIHKYQYNFTWLGRTIFQIPQDIVALQEIIWDIKPDLIIETGIAHGGSLIFYASLLELIGRGQVIGIDIDIRKHNRKEIEKHKMFKRIKMIEGSSIDNDVIKSVTKMSKNYKKIMVCLDSLHTEQHVLNELNLYSKLVTKGSYLIVFDTIIKDMPNSFSSDRPWNKTNNPATAVKIFLKNNKDFIVDKEIGIKLLISAAPSGYLKKVR